jgi:hypothetical protein
MNELLLLAPLYLEVNNLRIFEPFFLLLSAPGSCSTRGKIKKERKTLQIFPFFLGTGEWHSIERGAGWLDCQLPSSFALLVYTDRYMASTTLYNSSLLLYVVWLFSPSFNFSPPVSFRPENGPHSLPDTFFFSKKVVVRSLTIKEVPVPIF